VLCGEVFAADDVLAVLAADRGGEQAAALCLARQAFDTYCLTRTRLSVPPGLPPAFQARSGVFVSAMVHGAPRCCMGALYPTQPTLAEEIIAAASAAAGLDARFRAIRPDELSRLRLIVSVVGPPEAVSDVATVDPVTEGIAARWHDRIGVVLPGETRDRVRAARWACRRAGVPAGARPEYFRVRAVRMMEAQP
jgi:AMMECR1 domain-containing protein